MKEIINFLQEVDRNNNREWFAENKEWYKKVQAKWNKFALELIQEVGKFDEKIKPLTLNDCTYRFYRDTRFSKDKTPYKTHFGVFMSPGGKKSMHAGYYFHISTGNTNTYPDAHMLASGNYCYDSNAVKIIREDISDGWNEFETDILQKVDSRFVLDMEGALKKVPKEYDNNAPYSEWMRLKSYCLNAIIDESFITAPHLATRVADIFETTKPFCDFINRAVDYANEEMI